MLKGTITCSCSQIFGFTTSEEEVLCPSCGQSYMAIEHLDPIVIVEEGPPTEGGDESAIDI